MEPKEIEWWLKYTKTARRLRPGSRLSNESYPLSSLLSPNALVVKDGIPCARLFHGTRSQNLPKILRDGLRPVGGGALGRGFYMTPILEKALVYTSKSQQTQKTETFPIVLEIFLPHPETIQVCCLDRSSEDSCCKNGDLYTDYDELWQFLAKDQEILRRCMYDLWII